MSGRIEFSWIEVDFKPHYEVMSTKEVSLLFDCCCREELSLDKV